MLVWQAARREMNATVPQAVIDRAHEDDPALAAVEYGAEFRTDVESFVSREAVEACVIPDRRELPPVAGVAYRAFTDPSGGSSDAMTLAIGHRQDETVVVDCVREVTPPFSPESVVTEFVTLLKQYGVHSVVGDRYGGEWPREQFRKLGCEYELSVRFVSKRQAVAVRIDGSRITRVVFGGALTSSVRQRVQRIAVEGSSDVAGAYEQPGTSVSGA